jgi:hypothetical protein
MAAITSPRYIDVRNSFAAPIAHVPTVRYAGNLFTEMLLLLTIDQAKCFVNKLKKVDGYEVDKVTKRKRYVELSCILTVTLTEERSRHLNTIAAL